jgi:hypothetical protein
VKVTGTTGSPATAGWPAWPFACSACCIARSSRRVSVRP